MVVVAAVVVRLEVVGFTVVVVVEDVEVDLKVVELNDDGVLLPSVLLLDSTSSVEETSSTRLFPTRADPVYPGSADTAAAWLLLPV